MSLYNQSTGIRNVIWEIPSNVSKIRRPRAVGQFQFKGKTYRRRFCGVSKMVLINRAAIWVKELREQLGAPFSNDGPMVYKMNRGNPKLPPGVCIRVCKRKKGGDYLQFVATIGYKSKQLNQAFPIERYGYKKALRLALKQRRKWLKERALMPKYWSGRQKITEKDLQNWISR